MSIPSDCYWTLSDEFEGDAWLSGCSLLHSFFEGTPVDNNFHFCPYCGGFLVQQEEEEEEELLSDDEYYENDRDDENFIAEDD